MIRKHFAGIAATTLALAVSAQAMAGTVTTDGTDLVIKTKGGLEVATADKEFGFKIGGRLQADYSSFDGFYTKNGDSADAAYFRRAFLEVSGVAYKDWAYQVNYDFAHNAGTAADGYFDEASMAYNGLKPVSIKVGRFDPEFGLEKATSSKWVTGVERTAAYDLASWANAHENGLGLQVSGNVTPWLYGSAAVSSKDADSANANNTDGEGVKQYNLRAVVAPMAEAGKVLHLGANFARRDLSDTKVDLSVKSRLGIRGVSTGGGNDAGTNGNRLTLAGAGIRTTDNKTFYYDAGDIDNDSVFGLEAAWATGPFSVQGEYLKRKIKADAADVQDIDASGYYAQLAWTVTGEARGYKLGKFDAIKPASKATGAWEVYYRYDSLSMDDKNYSATDTEAKVHNLGVNWYVNEAVKLSGAYVKTSVDTTNNTQTAPADDDTGSGVVFRAQYLF